MIKVLPGVIVALVMLNAGSGVLAADEAREKLVVEFTKAIGLEDMIRQQQRDAERQVMDQIAPLLESLRQEGFSPDAIKEIQGGFNDLMKKVLNSWDPAEADRLYAGAIAEAMSDEALKAAIAFYESPEGVKSKAAIATASGKLSAYINTRIMAALKPGLQAYIEQVKVIAAKDRQRKAEQKPAPAPTTQASEPPPAGAPASQAP